MKPRRSILGFAGKRFWTIFLLVFDSISHVESGQNFKECLGNDLYQAVVSISNTYNTMIGNYAWTWCCFKNQCTGFPCHFPQVDVTFQCGRVGQSIFCITAGFSETEPFGEFCGGILGEVMAVDSIPTAAYCPSLNIVSNAIGNGPTTDSTFTWLCCVNGNICWAPSNVSVNNGLATTNCGYSYGFFTLACFQDNEGWTCAGGAGSTSVSNKKILSTIYLGIGQIIPYTANYSCLLQLGNIGPSKNTLPASFGGSPSSLSTVTQTVTEIIVTEKGIPAWGTALVGVGSSVITILLGAVIRFGWLFWNRPVMLPIGGPRLAAGG